MQQKCDCGKVYGEKGDLSDKTITGGKCPDHFIEWLEGFIKRLEAKGDPRERLPFLKKLLTLKLIQRQEATNDEDSRIMRTRGGGYV